MKVLGYVRLSDASREESTSVARQRQVIERYALSRDFDLVEIVEDVDVSATKTRLDRPGLDRVRDLIARGEADAVIVWRLDRLARSVVDFGTLLDEGLNVVSATEPLDTTTPIGRAMAEVLQVFAAMEARTIAERVRGSVDYLRRNLRFAGGVVPYGYRPTAHPSGRGRALEVDPEEAAVVRRMADEVLGGRAVYTVSQDLNRRGVLPRRAKQWGAASVRWLLTSDATLGRVTVKGELLRDEGGLPVVAWPPLLPVEDVEQLRALLAPKRSQPKRKRASRLLSGLLTCTGCGAVLTVKHTRRPNGARIIQYGCPTRGRGHLCARPVVVQAAAVEAEVEAAYLETAGRLEVVEEIVRMTEPADLAAVREAISDTASAMTAADADVPALVERLTLLRARRVALEEAPSEPVVERVATGRTVRETWAARDVDGRRALLEPSLRGPIAVRPSDPGPLASRSPRLSIPWAWTTN